MILKRGMRDKLDNHMNSAQKFKAVMKVRGVSVYDFCCFGVDENDKLSDDRYMIFYNQTSSPNGEITYFSENSGASFEISLPSLPRNVRKLVFTVSIDGGGTMGEIGLHEFSLIQNGAEALSLSLDGSSFQQEKAIITAEIYFKDSWRINVIARGFNGGLADLLKAYGGEEVSEQTAAPSPTVYTPPAKNTAAMPSMPELEPLSPISAPPVPSVDTGKVSLEKKIERQAPQLVSLVKPLKVELDKRKLNTIKARVALVMDMSGSMMKQYGDGTVQEIINKILPIAVQFDDNGELDFWYFGTDTRKMPAVTLENYKTAVPSEWQRLMYDLGYGNNEVKVMRQVIDRYAFTKMPVYVIFITDGEVGNSSEIKKLMREASEKPIFWQFVGVSGKDYGVLKKLDTLKGRYIDNANFFALDDFRSVSTQELYSRLLNEFPLWLQAAKNKNMF